MFPPTCLMESAQNSVDINRHKEIIVKESDIIHSSSTSQALQGESRIPVRVCEPASSLR